MAASAAHIAHPPGKQQVSSESCTWLREHWHTTLGQVKLQLDQFFLAGVNHIFYQGTCYSPHDAPWPGWYFYASTKFDWRNSIWRDIPHLNTWVARCQSVLQSGTPENDLLLYWPVHDLWSEPEFMQRRFGVHRPLWMSGARVGQVAQQLMDKGYTLDFISDKLLEKITFDDGRLRAPGGSYRAIVVPACKFMPPETLRLLADLAEQGALVLFEGALPEDVPGLAHLDERPAAFAVERTRVEQAAQVVANLPAALEKAGVPRESMVDVGLQFIRRRLDDGHYYFIVNHTAHAWEGWLPLAVQFESASLHDPMTGESGLLDIAEIDGFRRVYLQLEPGASIIVRTYNRIVDGDRWTYLAPAGSVIPLDGSWTLEFIEGGPSLPDACVLNTLTSWTETPDAAANAFAGTGRYSCHFDLPEDVVADDWLLDLGDVRESARVRLNGQEAGTLAALPFEMRVGRLVKPGENTLQIEVTNLSANRIRELDQKSDDWRIMRDADLVTVDYKPFEASQWPIVDSGLLGPVRLVPMKKLDPSTGLEKDQ